jgi:iron complex outermembrane receptor protein
MSATTRVRAAGYTRQARRLRTSAVPAPSAARSTIGLAVAAALAGVALPHRMPAIAANASSDTLAEVVVTARKVEENLQDVPISISVLTQKDLKNLGISQFEDYATRIPSISFISAGPGTQFFVIRGVSDGSNPNYANSSATGFFLDDMSLSYAGVQPDLHLYDLERIEVLNGPQGTTFGAGAMSGAVRYITNKPDVKAFSAGGDFDGGRIDAGGNNWTYEGFVNVPLVAGKTALRLSAFSSYHGGFIDNRLTTRRWVNGRVSNNAAWAGKDYNTEHVEGARVAIKQVFSEGWSAWLSYDYQRQDARGAWDELGAPRTVARFGPEAHLNYTKAAGFHVDGDVGIADLVFASTYWSLANRWVGEYSEYMQYAQTATLSPQYLQGFACLTDPVTSSGADNFSGCNVPTLYYDYRIHPERWSNELRLTSKPGGRFHWLGGVYREKTRDHYGDFFHMPGIQTAGQAWQAQKAAYAAYYTTSASPLPEEWYSYTSRFDYLQTTEFADIAFDLTGKLSVEAGVVHFHSDSSTFFPYGGFSWVPKTATPASVSSSNKWNSKLGINYKAAEHLLLYATFGQGFRDGGANNNLPASCYNPPPPLPGVPRRYVPDTLNNFEVGWKSTSLGGRALWNGAVYYMPWKQLQTLLYDPDICGSSSFYANIGDARIYGVESNVDYKVNEHLSLQVAASYTDAHLISNAFTGFPVTLGERLPYVPYFSYSWNVRYEQALGARFRGYGQFDMAHKGDMWNDLHANGSNGLPRELQPSYEILNVRFGVNPGGSRWLAELYITNFTNKNAVVYTNTGNFDLRRSTNEPRVFGLRLNYRFGKVTETE